MNLNFSVTEDNTRLPDWVRENIMMRCPYCGSAILDNSNTGVMTSRWCSNAYCPGHMQYKVEALVKHFGSTGFGVKSAYKWVMNNRGKSHMEILKEMFQEKPTVRLSVVAKLAFIRGYGETSAAKELDSYVSFEDYFANEPNPNPILKYNEHYLLDCQSYFNIEKPLAKLKMLVMGSGPYTGFSSRDEFFHLINSAFGSHVHVMETKGARKTGVYCLIKENNAPDRSKSRIAKECGIPIYTPQEFFLLMKAVFEDERKE